MESAENEVNHTKEALPKLALAALGVVFGDIGTSPLYALRESFSFHSQLVVNEANVLGVLSLVFWSLIFIISIKYLTYVMRADNRGEGGVLALMALAQGRQRSGGRDKRQILVLLGLFGAALLYGDGVITPAISVLSAIEGISVATPVFDAYVVPLTIAVLCLIFVAQRFGTARIGVIFGPILLLWFLVLATLGIHHIVQNPHVLLAINPLHAWDFFMDNKWHAFVALGSIFLVVTGGEALYADMGHFGRLPIRLAWFALVLPALLLNYFGQGSLLLSSPEAISNPFFNMAPTWALYPLVVLATSATVIASQALISGAFSMTRQAVQLGYLPRLEVNHTSQHTIGQIYIPYINWLLLIATCWLVLEFRSSSALASAYGFAVTATMAITTILTYYVARYRWHWRLPVVLGITLFFATIDLAFFSANLVKVLDGGWIPFVLGVAILVMMLTWRQGRRILALRLKARSIPFDRFMKSITAKSLHRVEGAAVFMTGSIDGMPPALLHNVRHNHILHEAVILMMVNTEEVPYLQDDERMEVEVLGEGFYKIVLHYGFMDTPDVPRDLAKANIPGLNIDLNRVTYFLGRETLIASPRPGMAIWRERLFSFMSRNAQRATTFFSLPTEQVIEIGIQVEL